MLADSGAETRSSEAQSGRRRIGAGRDRLLGVQRLGAFLGGTGLVLAYALRGGGSYDIVAFEQNGLVVWLLLALGIAAGALPRSRPSRPQLLLLAALLAYAAWTALSLTWTSSSERTFEEVARTLDYLGLAVLLSAVFDRRTWRAGGAGIGFGAMVVLVVALGSRLDPSLFGHDQTAATLGFYRLSVPFGYWNAVAAWGAMCTAIGLAWSAHDTSRLRRAVALGLVPVAGVTTYLTYSRAGIFGTSLAVIAVVVLSRNRLTAIVHAVVAAAGTAFAVLVVTGQPQIAHAGGTRGAGTVLLAVVVAAAVSAAVAALTGTARLDRARMPRRASRVAAALAAVAALVAAVVVGPHLASRAWHSFTRTTLTQDTLDPTVRLTSLSGERYPVWKSAVKAFDTEAAHGLGAGTFAFWWSERGTTDESLLDVHNIWLQNLAELGVPGFLLIITVAGTGFALALIVRRRVRRATSAGVATAASAALLVYLLHASVDWMWESTAVTALAIAGVAVAGARLAGDRPRPALPARAVLAVLAGLACVAQLPGIESTLAIRHSQAAVRAGQGFRALALAQDAVHAEPWSASAYEQRGLVYEALGRLRAAAADLRHAISEEPLNYAHWLVLARIQTEAGHVAAAVSDYDTAHRLAPRAEVFSFAPYFSGGAPRRSS